MFKAAIKAVLTFAGFIAAVVIVGVCATLFDVVVGRFTNDAGMIALADIAAVVAICGLLLHFNHNAGGGVAPDIAEADWLEMDRYYRQTPYTDHLFRDEPHRESSIFR